MVGFALLCFALTGWICMIGMICTARLCRVPMVLRGGGDVRGGEGGRSVHSELNWWFVRCRSGD